MNFASCSLHKKAEITASTLAQQNGTMKVTHTKTMFTMTGRYWSGTYPLSDLPKWLSFYQRFAQRFPKIRRVI